MNSYIIQEKTIYLANSLQFESRKLISTTVILPTVLKDQSYRYQKEDIFKHMIGYTENKYERKIIIFLAYTN
jgi:hypothetical protein